MIKRGYVQIYTGDGKGKTTAALGVALRAAGAGKRTLLIQFMKAGFPYREYESLKRLSEWIEVERFGTDEFVMRKRTPSAKERGEIAAGLECARKAFAEARHDIVILDEVCVAVHFGAINAQEVMQLIRERPEPIELILTGRYCPTEWYELADLVTEMREIKHYYTRGVLSRPGIDS